MTLRELSGKLYTHNDVGVSLRINSAIKALIEEGALRDGDVLTQDKLGEIRRKLCDLPVNPEDLLLVFLPGASGNPAEASLQYIEDLMRQKQK